MCTIRCYRCYHVCVRCTQRVLLSCVSCHGRSPCRRRARRRRRHYPDMSSLSSTLPVHVVLAGSLGWQRRQVRVGIIWPPPPRPPGRPPGRPAPHASPAARSIRHPPKLRIGVIGIIVRPPSPRADPKSPGGELWDVGRPVRIEPGLRVIENKLSNRIWRTIYRLPSG